VPESLKAKVDEAAQSAGVSTNAWGLRLSRLACQSGVTKQPITEFQKRYAAKYGPFWALVLSKSRGLRSTAKHARYRSQKPLIDRLVAARNAGFLTDADLEVLVDRVWSDN
jgi:hypothetical protein